MYHLPFIYRNSSKAVYVASTSLILSSSCFLLYILFIISMSITDKIQDTKLIFISEKQQIFQISMFQDCLLLFC